MDQASGDPRWSGAAGLVWEPESRFIRCRAPTAASRWLDRTRVFTLAIVGATEHPTVR
jgi:hypothetical protein